MTERNPIPPCLSHLEQMLPKRASNTAIHFLLRDLRAHATTQKDDEVAEMLWRVADILEALLPRKEPEPPPMGMVLVSPGMTTAERQLLLTTSSWLASLLMGHLSVGKFQGGLTSSDGAGILRTHIEAVRREREGG